MTAIFTGLGSGFVRSSASALGNSGLLGSASTGRGGDSVTVNAATGNLVISRQDEFLVGRGPDLAISRTYNSLAEVSDGDNGDQWQMGTARRVFGFTGTLNTAGSTVKRVSEDGSVVTYAYGTRGGVAAYWTTDGDGAHDKLVKSGTTWIWTDGTSQLTETYEASVGDAAVFRIKEQADTDGNKLTFAYGAGTDKLDRVTTQNNGTANAATGVPEQSYVQYTWSGNNISQIVTGYTDFGDSATEADNLNKTLTRTRYAYDASNRLITVTVDLSPGDNSIADGKTYVTSYTYDGSSKRVASITQTDGSSLSITYDGSGRVATLTQAVATGDTRLTTLSYGTNYTTVTGPDNQVTRLDYDGAKQLTKITAPPAYSGATAQTVQFGYDADGNVASVTDGAGKVTSYTYDAMGNVLTSTDPNSDVVTRTYGARNELLTETRTGSDASGAAVSHTTHYVYDGENHLRYTVSPEGHVTEYLYSVVGTPTLVIAYPEHRYDVAGPMSEGALYTWRSALPDRSSTAIRQYYYDGRDNLVYAIDYGYAIATGGGATSEGYKQTNFTYDQAGKLLSRLVATQSLETFVYDGLGRLVASTDVVGETTSIVFNDAALTTTVTTGAGRTSVSSYNKAGDLVGETHSGSYDVTGSASYLYDRNGRLRVATDATGYKSYYLYDKAGRKIADINHYGHVTEYRYDAAGRVAASISYTNALTAEQITALGDPNNAIEMASIRPAGHGYDIWSWSIYDGGGRLIESIDGDGGVAVFSYDASDRLVKTVSYYNKLSGTQLTAFKTTAPAASVLPTANAAKDAVSRTFYDRDGRTIGTLDGEGYLTETVYDEAGRKVEEVAYAAITSSSYWAAGTLDQLRASAVPTSGSNRRMHYVYDGQSLLRYTVDNAGYVTQYQYRGDTLYEAVGLLRGTIVLAAPISTTDFTYDNVKALVAAIASDANDRESYSVCNAKGQVAYAVDAGGQVTGFTYDAAGRVTRTVQYAVLRGTPSLPTVATMNTWAAGQAGNAANRVTRNWYTAGGDLRFSVDAEGYIRRYDYDAEGRLTREVTWANAVTATDATTIAQAETLTASAGTWTDVRYTYDAAGRRNSVYDGEGNRTVYSWYANGALSSVYYAYGTADQSRTLYVNDGAGRTKAEYFAYGEAEQAVVQYAYDGLGNQVSVTDANGKVTNYAYDERGQVLTMTDAANGVTTYEYNAFGEVVKATDPRGNSTYSYYDTLGRVTLVRDAESYLTETTYTAFGEVDTVTRRYNKTASPPSTTTPPTVTAHAKDATTNFDYDKLGRVTQKIDVEGYVETSTYTAFGQLLTFGRYELSVYGSYGGQSGAIQQAFADAALLQETADGLAAAAAAADAAKATALAAKNAAQTTFNTAQTTANASAANVTSLQQTISTLQAQVAARPENAVILSPLSYLQAYFQAYLAPLYAQVAAAQAYAAQLPPEQQYGYYMSVLLPLQAQVDAAATIANAVIGSVQAGNPLPSQYYSAVLTQAGYNATQISSYTALAQNLTNAQASLSAAQTTAAADAAALAAAQTALNQATTAYNQAVSAATAAQTAASTAQANATAALAHAQQLSSDTSNTLPAFTLGALEGAATTAFQYDRRGNLIRTTDARGFYETYTYDALGQRTTSVAKSATGSIAAGGTTTYTYYKNGLLKTETLPIQSYNSAGTALGAITHSYQYDARGNLVRRTEAQGLPEQRVTDYTYDKLDRLETTVGAAVSGVTINASTKAVSAVSGSPTETLTYDPNGNVTKRVDAAGAASVFFYDNLNRKTVEIDALGVYTAYQYDANGNVANIRIYETAVVVPSNGGAAAQAPAAPSGAKRETGFTYDKLGRVLTSTVVLPDDYRTGTWNGSAWTNLATTALTSTYEYDALGNVVKLTDPNGSATFGYYDKLGRKTAQVDAQGYLTSWAYDSDGNVLSERRYTTRFTGTPTIAASPAVSPDAGDRITSYTYDKNGNRLSEARAGVVVHNGSGGTNTVTSTIAYLYNGLGQVIRKTEATGDQFNYTYDAGGRLTQETRPGFVSNTGASVTPQVNYYYDGLGNLVRNVQAAGGDAAARVTAYAYGAGGRLSAMTDAEGGVRSYSYDLAGRTVLESYTRTVTAANGTTSSVTEGIGYRYDVLGRSLGQGFYAKPASTWNFQSGNDWTTLEYDAFGDVVRTGVNGAWQQENKYDLAGRLWATNSGDGMWKYFGYDKGGNQTLAIASAGANLAGKTFAQAFALIGQADVDGTYTVYDKRNLATSVVEEGRELTASGSSNLTTSRTWNAFGEVASETNAAGATVTYSYNTMGRMIRSESPTVWMVAETGAGSWIKPSQDYYYDASGRLVATRDANGTYATGGTEAGGKPKAANTGNLTRLTLLAGTGYGGSEALVTLETHADTGVRQTKYDIHGDARVVIDEENRTLASQTYDGLGRLIAAARIGGLTDTYTYDVLGQQVTHWNSLTTSSNKEIATFDIQGRIISARAFGGDVTSMTYTWDATLEAAGTGLVDTGGWSQVTTYANTMTATEKSDLFGRAIAMTDLGGHVTNYTYDLAGRLTRSQIGTTSYNYEYYNTGQVRKAYTVAPNWTYYTSTASAAVSNTFSSSTTQNATYTYDAAGNRLTEYGTLVNGSTTVVWKDHTATYDKLGRLLTDTVAATSVQPAASVAFQYDANGNVRSKTSTYRTLDASGGFGSTANAKAAWYRYDSMNRVVINNGVLSGSQIVLGLPVSIDFIGDPSQSIAYNKAGQRVSTTTKQYFQQYIPGQQTPWGGLSAFTATYAAPTREDYVYDAAGRLDEIKVTDSWLDVGTWILNMPQGLPPETYVVTSSTATRRSKFTYDAMGRQTAQNGYAANGTTVVYNTTTTWDARGQASNSFASTLKSDGKTYTQTVTNQFGTAGTTGYALGAVVSSTSVNTVTGQSNKTSSTTNTFQWWDSAVQNTIAYDADTGSSSNPVYTTTFTYNGLGQMTKAQIGDGQPRTVTFSLDEIGQIIRRDETNVSGQTGAPHELWYRLGDREIGYVGNNGGEDPTLLGSLGQLQQATGTGTFRNGATTARSSIGFAQALDPVNAHEQGSTAGGYTVRSGDTLQTIAQRLYGDASLWYKVAEVNGLGANASLIQGQQLTLPSGVTRNTYTSDSFRPYDPAQAIGDLSPTTPKPAKNNKCGTFGVILLAAIAIGVSMLLPAVGALTPSMFGGGILGGAVSGAIGAAAGSVVSQGVGLATGIQEKFSFKGVALAALSGAVGGGFQGSGVFGQASGKAFTPGSIGIKSGIVDAAVSGAASSAITQGVAVATGLQDKFSWAGVAAAGVAAGVGHLAGGGLPSLVTDASLGNFASQVGTGMAALIASAATRSAIEGTSFGDNIKAGLPDVIGQAIGNAIAGGIAGSALQKSSTAVGTGQLKSWAPENASAPLAGQLAYAGGTNANPAARSLNSTEAQGSAARDAIGYDTVIYVTADPHMRGMLRRSGMGDYQFGKYLEWVGDQTAGVRAHVAAHLAQRLVAPGEFGRASDYDSPMIQGLKSLPPPWATNYHYAGRDYSAAGYYANAQFISAPPSALETRFAWERQQDAAVLFGPADPLGQSLADTAYLATRNFGGSPERAHYNQALTASVEGMVSAVAFRPATVRVRPGSGAQIDWAAAERGLLPSGVGGTGAAYNKATGQGLYVLRDELGNVRYIGRGDAPARISTHADSIDKSELIGEVLYTNNLTKAQAKGLEQRLINEFGGATTHVPESPLLNKINSYSSANPNASLYRDAATEALWQDALKKVGR